MDDARILRELKRDVFGSVELWEIGAERVVRRVARGSGVPGSGWIARRLMGRERAALARLGDQPHMPRLLEGHPVAVLACADGSQPGAGEVLVRSWIEGEPLHRATELPRDFFDLLDDLCFTLHRAGICHNDLHKEQNLVVQPDGRPALIDFQLASVHARQGRGFRTRASEDLRHLQKHRRRYTRDGRGPFEASEGAGFGRRRGLVARTWRRFGKPVYRFVTRRVLRTSDAEERRPSSGPWPTWTDPLGPT